MPEITVHGVDFDADEVEAVLDELDDEETVKDETAYAGGDVFLEGDGWLDDDVDLTHLPSGEVAECIGTNTLRDMIEDARSSEGPFLKAEAVGDFGFKIPLDDVSGNVEMDLNRWESGGNNHIVAWNTDVDVSDMNNDGSGSTFADDDSLDGHAAVETVEVVDS